MIHSVYPHNEGTLYDCPACEAICFCEDDFDCLHCELMKEEE